MKSEFSDRPNEESRADAGSDSPNEAPSLEREAAAPESSEEAGTAATDAGAELEAMRDRYLRLAAEYDNFRKRTDRERAESRDRAQAQIVEKLLEPLDDLKRVADFSAETTSAEALLEGVQLVERKLLRALEAAGLETVDARGQRFDPEVHEALMMTPTEKAEEDETVGEVFQAGYRFRGVLLRPARVQVRQHG